MTKAARVPCPFGPCVARPEVLALRGISLQYPAQDLIREHVLDPDSWFGLCPASGQAWPLSVRAVEALAEQAETLRRMRAERDAKTIAAGGGVRPLKPKPLKWPGLGSSDPMVPGPTARQGLKLVFNANKQGGLSVTTTAEVKAALDAANENITQAVELARLSKEKLDDAIAKINYVRENTVETLGVPQCTAAKEQIEQAQQLCLVAIEANETYGAML